MLYFANLTYIYTYKKLPSEFLIGNKFILTIMLHMSSLQESFITPEIFQRKTFQKVS